MESLSTWHIKTPALGWGMVQWWTACQRGQDPGLNLQTLQPYNEKFKKTSGNSLHTKCVRVFCQQTSCEEALAACVLKDGLEPAAL